MYDNNDKTLANLRRDMALSTGKLLSRSAFWERLATKRLFAQLEQLTSILMVKLSENLKVDSLLAKKLGVQGIVLLDSSSTTLSPNAADIFPAPRSNVCPAILFDLMKSSMIWYELSEAKKHDRNSFPNLELLRNQLSIFDLGYYDFELFKDLDDFGCKFLSRVKDNTNIRVEEVITGLPKRQFENFYLLDRLLPKKKKKIVEVHGWLEKNFKPFLKVRVIGFWNKDESKYHWYMTNLWQVPSHLIYPLYRLRWQAELVFKAAKSSLRLKDIPSSNTLIIKNLVMATLVGTLIAFPLAKCIHKNSISNAKSKTTCSLQRAAYLFCHLRVDIRNFIANKSRKFLTILLEKIKLLKGELFDPNYKKRKSTLQFVLEAA